MKCSMKCTRKTFPEINPEINLSARQFSLLWRRVNITPRQGVLRENTWFNITEVNGRNKFSPNHLDSYRDNDSDQLCRPESSYCPNVNA